MDEKKETTQGSPTQDSTEGLQIRYGDGGYGPLDSDDIEWLIESGHYKLPMPVKPDADLVKDAA